MSVCQLPKSILTQELEVCVEEKPQKEKKEWQKNEKDYVNLVAL